MPATLSVCIPSYNRTRFLPALLESIERQQREPLEVVICEDKSPERQAIRDVVSAFRDRLPIRYFENDENLGYDANLRRCLDVARGDYCVMMGNDDVMSSDALRLIAGTIDKAGPVGVICRAYRVFRGDPSCVEQEIVHFPTARFFPAGRDAVVSLYRRMGVISGLTFHRAASVALSTTKWDGSLYYQLYLAASILLRWNGAYVPVPLVSCRDGIAPDFGNSNAERKDFVPGQYTNAARLAMFSAMIEIVRDVEERTGVPLVGAVLKDLGAYSYYLLDCQAQQPLADFFRYYRALGRLGLSAHPLYHVYFLALATLGPAGSLGIISRLRRVLGRTPRLSNIQEGIDLDSPIPATAHLEAR